MLLPSQTFGSPVRITFCSAFLAITSPVNIILFSLLYESSRVALICIGTAFRFGVSTAYEAVFMANNARVHTKNILKRRKQPFNFMDSLLVRVQAFALSGRVAWVD